MSSKQLKCIGGVWDGRKVVLEDGRRQMVVRVRPAPLWINPHGAPLGTIQYTEHLYVLDQVNIWDADPIEYLRPSEWDGERALRHALGPT